VQLGFGIYNYYAAVIPDEFPLIKPLMIFFPNGDKQKGIEQLKDTAFNGKFAKYEARYFLMTLYYRYENNLIIADNYAKLLIDDFPDNPVFEKWRGRISVRLGNTNLADSIFNDVLAKADKKYPGYNTPNSIREANYYIGNNLKNNGQLDSAKIYFEKCYTESQKIDKEDDESGFQINSVLYLAQIAESFNKRDEAIRLYNKLLDMKNYGNSHSIAESSLKKLKSN
jgi:tetratricopeptide (TPR) repeat protein